MISGAHTSSSLEAAKVSLAVDGSLLNWRDGTRSPLALALPLVLTLPADADESCCKPPVAFVARPPVPLPVEVVVEPEVAGEEERTTATTGAGVTGSGGAVTPLETRLGPSSRRTPRPLPAGHAATVAEAG